MVDAKLIFRNVATTAAVVVPALVVGWLVSLAAVAVIYPSVVQYPGGRSEHRSYDPEVLRSTRDGIIQFFCLAGLVIAQTSFVVAHVRVSLARRAEAVQEV